uniref:GIY-YIG domain-containing protein n=1 Tax=Trichogramma kaykai TaxID=54128 RepID=A0ABD2XLW9_9HYME
MDKRDKTGVVYSLKCKDCPASYVGETKRRFAVRINEHKNAKEENSVVAAHTTKCIGHTFDWDATKILDNESNGKRRLISEMLYICDASYAINKKEDTQRLNSTYSNILKYCKR